MECINMSRQLLVLYIALIILLVIEKSLTVKRFKDMAITLVIMVTVVILTSFFVDKLLINKGKTTVEPVTEEHIELESSVEI